MALVNDTFVTDIYAVFNPIVRTVSRYDWAFTAVTESVHDEHQVVLEGVGVPDGFAMGQLIRVIGSVYHGTYEIVAVEAGKVQIDLTYSATDSGIVINNSVFENPYLETEIYNGDRLIATAYNSPDIDGLIKIDYSKFLKNLFSKDNMFDYDVINVLDTNMSSTFKSRHKEHWNGSELDTPVPSWTALTADICILNAAMQLQDVGGGKLSQYALYNPPYDTSKFLTKFERPKWFYGYPFDLQFIRWSNVPAVAIVLRRDTIHYEQNGTLSSFHQDNLVAYLTYGISRMMLHDCATDEAIVDVYLKAEIASVFTDVIQNITVDVDHNCYDNAIYLCWLNTFGGWDYWLFHTDYLETLNNEIISFKNNYVEDWENEETVEDIIKRNAFETIRLGAVNLTKQQSAGLKGLLYSARVLMLSNASEYIAGGGSVAPTWKTVIVQEETFEFDKRPSRNGIEFEIKLPPINIQEL